MTKKGSGKKDALLHPTHEGASKPDGLKLPPLKIGLDGFLKLKDEAAPVSQRTRAYDAKDADAKPPGQIAEEPAGIDELHDAEFQSPDIKTEIEAPETPPEAVDKAETASLLERSKLGLQSPWSKILTKFRDEGQHGNKRVYLAIISISLSLFGCLSVFGLIQTTGSANFSGLVVQPRAYELEMVQAGGFRARSAIFYIKNINDEAVILSFITENWDPAYASDYMEISWDYDGTPVEPGNGLEITFTLVDSSNTGIENYSFDIVFMGSAS